MAGDPPAQQGSIMLTFDDGSPSFYSAVYPLLVSKNIKATNYVITDKLDTEESYTTEQAQEMYAAGVDIANHADHTDLTLFTLEEIKTKVLAAKAALDAAGMTRASAHVAYPFGFYNSTTKAAMRDAGMITARSTDDGYANLREVNEGGGIYAIPVRPYILRSTTLAAAKAFVDTVKASNYHAVFLFHRILDTPEAAYDWATADLGALMDYINEQEVQTLTISQWYALYDAVY